MTDSKKHALMAVGGAVYFVTTVSLMISDNDKRRKIGMGMAVVGLIGLSVAMLNTLNKGLKIK